MTVKTTAFTLPSSWPPEGVSPTEGWMTYGPDLLAYLIRFDYHHELSPTVFEYYFPDEVQRPLMAPGEEPTDSSSAHRIWDAQIDRYEAKRAAMKEFLAQVLATYPQYIKQKFIDPRRPSIGTALITIAVLWDTLNGEYGTPLPSDLQQWRDKLAVSYDSRTSLSAFIQGQRQIHNNFAQINQPLPESEKFNRLKTAMVQCGSFQFSLQSYAERYPSIATQSFETLAEALVNYETNNPLSATSSSQGYAASVKGSEEPQNITPDMISKLVAAAVKEALTSQKNQKLYCWTHGTNSSHKSAECRYPREGHQIAATAANKMGGNLSEWRPRHKN